MKDPRCLIGMHKYPTPDKDHPVDPQQIRSGYLTLECPRCHSTKTIPWRNRWLDLRVPRCLTPC